MVVLNVQVNNCTPQTIVIGRRGTYDTMQADFLAEWSALLVSDSARVMWAITLSRADERQMMQESWGAFPDMTPEPQPEPEPEPSEEA